MKAKDDLLSKEPPNSFYQFERDFKGIKNDAVRRLKYLMNIKPQNYKNIFRSDLEAEIMLQIFQTYLDGAAEGGFWEKNAEYLVDVLTEI